MSPLIGNTGATVTAFLTQVVKPLLLRAAKETLFVSTMSEERSCVIMYWYEHPMAFTGADHTRPSLVLPSPVIGSVTVNIIIECSAKVQWMHFKLL